MYQTKAVNMRKYDVCLAMPGIPIRFPAGGTNIILQLAKGLKETGLNVCLVYVPDTEKVVQEKTGEKINLQSYALAQDFLKLIRGPKFLKFVRYVWNLFHRLKYDYSKIQEIDESIVFSTRNMKIRCEKIVACDWWTPYLVDSYNADSAAMKYRLTLAMEDIVERRGKDANLAAISYSFNAIKIVSDINLFRRFREEGPKFILLGIDHSIYKLDNPINGRSKVVLFPLRNRPGNGIDYLLTAISKLNDICPQIKFVGFGNLRPVLVPNFIDYYYKPANELLKKLYNESSVFVMPSTLDDFALPVLEAMACGSAVITTNNGGIYYIKNNYNGILVPPKDSEAIVNAVMRLLVDENFRISVAERGKKTSQAFTYEQMVSSFLKALQTTQENRL